jgi:hypothetical protein
MSNGIQFSPSKPVEMFDAFVPQGLQVAIAAGIVSEYRLAKVACDTEYHTAESEDLLPFVRRACIESMLCGLPKSHPDARIVTRSNKTKNCSHRVLVCGRILLTQSLVEHGGILPREAEYRKGYARDAQYLLFEHEEAPAEDAPLYGIVTHMPVSRQDAGVPAFIDILFPDPNYRVIARIPLLGRFPAVLGRVEIAEPETIPDNLETTLRKTRERS